MIFDTHWLPKGLQRQRLIGSAVTGLNHARTITKASVMGLDGRQDDYNKGICSPGSLFSLKGLVVFDFSNVAK